MPRGKRQITATGFYTAIALIVYALIGAITNDLYIPGRRSGGVHLHNEAIPPALLGIFLAALTLPLQHFRKTTWLARTRIALLAGAALSMLLCFYFIAFPSGRRLASVEQCQATFARIEQLSQAMTSDDHLRGFLRAQRSECATTPMLRSYHDCVNRAERAVDINFCGIEAKAAHARINAS